MKISNFILNKYFNIVAVEHFVGFSSSIKANVRIQIYMRIYWTRSVLPNWCFTSIFIRFDCDFNFVIFYDLICCCDLRWSQIVFLNIFHCSLKVWFVIFYTLIEFGRSKSWRVYMVFFSIKFAALKDTHLFLFSAAFHPINHHVKYRPRAKKKIINCSLSRTNEKCYRDEVNFILQIYM